MLAIHFLSGVPVSACGTVEYPVVFRNRGAEAISVNLDLAGNGRDRMEAATDPAAFEPAPGEAAASFVQVNIGGDIGRDEHEKHELRISVDNAVVGKPVDLSEPIEVEPNATTVLYLGGRKGE